MKKSRGGINVGKILTFVAVIIFLVYFFYQVISAVMPFTTGTAVYYDSYDGINTVGTVVRSETVLSSETRGVKYFVVGDGEKVSKGGVIANIYGTQAEAQLHSDLAALSEQIASITEVQSYNNTTAVDLELLNTKIDDALFSLISSCKDGNFSESAPLTAEVLKLMSRKKIAVGEEQDYSGLLAELNASYATLSASAPKALGSISSDASGYFVSMADGYETVLTAESIMTMTPEQLSSVSPTAPDEKTVGKIVSDYTWYIACTVPLSESAAFKVGDSVKLKTTLKSATELTATVAAINLGADDKVVMVFSCSNMNGDLATLRTIPITVVTGEYKGLRVSNSAVRVVDGKTGVYVISGMQAKFVEVNIIHTASGYTLCEITNDNSGNSLRLYDEVIERGRNLYDGKIVR